MKIHLALSCCMAVAIPSLSLADLPFSNEALGRIESVLNFCAKTISSNASQFETRGKILVKDFSEKNLEEARASSEYRDGYDTTAESLGKASKEQTAKACNGFLGTPE